MKKKNNTIPEIVIPKDYEIDEILDMDEDVIALRKYYFVFNGDVIDGIPEREKREIDPSGKNSRAEGLLQYWNDNEAKIVYGGNNAYYRPFADKIHLPERNAFFKLNFCKR